jgi:hypothetical protein
MTVPNVFGVVEDSPEAERPNVFGVTEPTAKKPNAFGIVEDDPLPAPARALAPPAPDRPGFTGGLKDVGAGIARGALGFGEALTEIPRAIENVTGGIADFSGLSTVIGKGLATRGKKYAYSPETGKVEPTATESIVPDIQRELFKPSGQRIEEERAMVKQGFKGIVDRTPAIQESAQAQAGRGEGKLPTFRAGLSSAAESVGMMIPAMTNPYIMWGTYGAPALNDLMTEYRDQAGKTTEGKAIAGGLAEFVLQGGVETLSTALEKKFFAGASLPAPVRKKLGATIVQWAKMVAKGYPKAAITELLEETVQGEGSTAIRKMLGMDAPEVWEATRQAALPTAIAVAMFGPLMAGSAVMAQRNRADVLDAAKLSKAPPEIVKGLETAKTEEAWAKNAKSLQEWWKSNVAPTAQPVSDPAAGAPVAPEPVQTGGGVSLPPVAVEPVTPQAAPPIEDVDRGEQLASQLRYPDVTAQVQDPRFKLYTDAGYSRAEAIQMVQQDQAEEVGQPITSPDGTQRVTLGGQPAPVTRVELEQSANDRLKAVGLTSPSPAAVKVLADRLEAAQSESPSPDAGSLASPPAAVSSPASRPAQGAEPISPPRPAANQSQPSADTGTAAEAEAGETPPKKATTAADKLKARVAKREGEGTLAVGTRVPWKNSPDPDEDVKEIEIVKLTPTVATVRWVGGTELNRLPRAAIEDRMREQAATPAPPPAQSPAPAPATKPPELMTPVTIQWRDTWAEVLEDVRKENDRQPVVTEPKPLTGTEKLRGRVSTPESTPVAPESTLTSQLNAGTAVKPRDATFVRVNGTQVVAASDVDTLKGAGPFKSAEWGTKGKAGFVPLGGKLAGLKEKVKKGSDVESLPAGIPKEAVLLTPTWENSIGMSSRTYIWDDKGSKYYVSNSRWIEPTSVVGFEDTPGRIMLDIRKIKPDGSHGPDIHTEITAKKFYGESWDSIHQKALKVKEEDDRRREERAKPTPVEVPTTKGEPPLITDEERARLIQQGPPSETVAKMNAEDAAYQSKKSPVRVETDAQGDVTVSVPKADKPGLPAKEQKKYLLAEIDKAIEGASAEVVEEALPLIDPKGYSPEAYADAVKSRATKNAEISARNREKFGTVTIEVPDDGTFEILNAKSSLNDLKKKAKKFPSTPSKADAPYTVPNIDPTAIPAVGKRPAAIKSGEWMKILQPFASTDETRTFISKPWADGKGNMAATDGRRQVVAIGIKGPADKPAKDERPFPDVSKVTPGGKADGGMPSTDWQEGQVEIKDTEKLIRQLRQAQAATGADQNQLVKLYLMPDGSIALSSAVSGRDDNRMEYEASYRSDDVDKGKRLLSVDMNYLDEILTFFRKVGNESVTLHYTDWRSPILITGAKEYAVLMPMRSGDESEQPLAQKPKIVYEKPDESTPAVPPVATTLRTQADTSLAGKTPQELLDLAAPYTQYGPDFDRNIATSVERLKIALEPGRGKFMQLSADELAVRLDAVMKPAEPDTAAEVSSRIYIEPESKRPAVNIGDVSAAVTDALSSNPQVFVWANGKETIVEGMNGDSETARASLSETVAEAIEGEYGKGYSFPQPPAEPAPAPAKLATMRGKVKANLTYSGVRAELERVRDKATTANFSRMERPSAVENMANAWGILSSIDRERREPTAKELQQIAGITRDADLAIDKAVSKRTAAAPRDPWQMTRAEYFAQGKLEQEGAKRGAAPARPERYTTTFHRDSIRQALAAGKPVPAAVLADYPELTPTAPTAATESASEKYNIDGPARLDREIQQAIGSGSTPYMQITRKLGNGRYQYEGYGIDGKLLATANGGRISGPLSVGGKLKKKGNYREVLNGLYEFESGESVTLDSVKAKLRETDDKIRANLSEVDRRMRDGKEDPSKEENPAFISAVRAAIESGRGASNTDIEKYIRENYTPEMGDIEGETKSGGTLLEARVYNGRRSAERQMDIDAAKALGFKKGQVVPVLKSSALFGENEYRNVTITDVSPKGVISAQGSVKGKRGTFNISVKAGKVTEPKPAATAEPGKGEEEKRAAALRKAKLLSPGDIVSYNGVEYSVEDVQKNEAWAFTSGTTDQLGWLRLRDSGDPAATPIRVRADEVKFVRGAITATTPKPTTEFATRKDVESLADQIEATGRKPDADNIRQDANRFEDRDPYGMNTLRDYAQMQLDSASGSEMAAPGVSPSDIPLDVATRAHNGTSMTPEVRGRMEQREYFMHMTRVWRGLLKLADTPEKKATAQAEFSRYRDNYRSKKLDLLGSHSRLVSSMIAGPSKFPARQMNKRGDAYGNRLNELVEWDKRAQTAMENAVSTKPSKIISSDDADAVDQLKAKIANAEKVQEKMKAANVIIRDKKLSPDEKVKRMVDELGFKESTARKALEPDYAGRQGFPAYELTNNSANIRRMQERVVALERSRAQKPVEVEDAATGIRIEDNVADNRLRIFFPGKPDETVRTKLKMHGFRWSPAEGAWQRFRGTDATYWAEQITGVKIKTRETDKGVAMYAKADDSPSIRLPLPMDTFETALSAETRSLPFAAEGVTAGGFNDEGADAGYWRAIVEQGDGRAARTSSDLSEVVYRGTPEGPSIQNTQMRGIFFTTSPVIAKGYSQGSGNVTAHRLVLKNPLRIDFDESGLSLYEIQQEVEKHLAGLASVFEDQTDTPDGLIVTNAQEGAIKHTEYVVFNKKQIKDADAPRFYRSRNGQVRAVTIGKRSHFFLDRYDNESQLRQDIREEAGHRLINELGGAAWSKIGFQTYKGQWTAIRDEIRRNYGFEPGTQDFNHELVAKALRDGKQDVSLMRRFMDAVVSAFRAMARRLGMNVTLSDAEVRNLLQGLLDAKARGVSGDGMGGGMQAAQTSRASQVTPDQDRAYMDAVERGDTAEAQRMVDEAAIQSKEYEDIVYHWSPVLDKAKFAQTLRDFDTSAGAMGHLGMFVTDDPEFQGAYSTSSGDEPHVFWLRKGKLFESDAPNVREVVERFVDSRQGDELYGSVYDLTDETVRSDLIDKAAEEINSGVYEQHSLLENASFVDFLADDGYEGTTNGSTYLLFDPRNHLKSADPITRDDQGRVIPLSERFNDASPDIRFSRGESEMPPAEQLDNDNETWRKYADENREEWDRLVGRENDRIQQESGRDQAQSGVRVTTAHDARGTRTLVEAGRRLASVGRTLIPVRGIEQRGIADPGHPAVFVNVDQTQDEIDETVRHETFHALFLGRDAAARKLYESVDTKSQGFRSAVVAWSKSHSAYWDRIVKAAFAKVGVSMKLASAAQRNAAAKLAWNHIQEELVADFMGDGSYSEIFSDANNSEQLKDSVLPIRRYQETPGGMTPAERAFATGAEGGASIQAEKDKAATKTKMDTLKERMQAQRETSVGKAKAAGAEKVKKQAGKIGEMLAEFDEGKAAISIAEGRMSIRAAANRLVNANLDQQRILRKELLNTVKEMVPDASVRDTLTRKILAAMLRLKIDQKAMDAALGQLDRMMDKTQRNKLIGAIISVYSKAVESMAINVNYRQRIRQLMDGFLLKKPTAASLAKAKELADFLEAEEAARSDTDLTINRKMAKLLEKLSKVPLSSLDVGQLEDIFADLSMLAERGKLYQQGKRQQEIDRMQADVDAVKAQGVRRFDAPVKEIGNIGDPPRFTQRFTDAMNAAGDAMRKWYLWHLPIDRLFDLMDDYQHYHGVIRRLFKGRPDMAFKMFRSDLFPVEQELKEMISHHKIGRRESMRIGMYGVDQQTMDSDPKYGRRKLYNNYGADTPERMAEVDRQVEAIKLTPDEQAVYEWMLTKFDSVAPALQKTANDVYNVEFDKINKYWPMQTDWEITENDPIAGYEMNEFGQLMKKNPEKGMIKARTGAGDQKVQIDSTRGFLKHMSDAYYMIHMAPVTKYMAELARHPEMAGLVGKEGQRMLLEYTDTMARKGGVSGDHVIRWVDTLRRNVGVGILGFRVTSALIQPTSFINAIGVLGPRGFKGAFDITQPGRLKWIVDNSTEIRDRVGDDPSFTEWGGSRATQKFVNAGYWPLERLDRLTAAAVFAAAYEANLRERGMVADYSQPADREAVMEAETVVRVTQASGTYKDTPLGVSRGKLLKSHSLSRILYQFQTFSMNTFAYVAHDGIGNALKNKEFGKAANMVMWTTLAFMAEEGIRAGIASALGGGGDDDKDYGEEIMWDFLGTVPLFGQMAGSMRYSTVPIPLVSAVTKVSKGLSSAVQGAKPETRQRGIVRTAGAIATLSGIPGSSQVSDLWARSITSDREDVSKAILDSAKRLPSRASEGRLKLEALRVYNQARRDGLLEPGTTLPQFRARYKAAFKRLNP